MTNFKGQTKEEIGDKFSGTNIEYFLGKAKTGLEHMFILVLDIFF